MRIKISVIFVALTILMVAPVYAKTKLVIAGSEAVDSLLDRMSVKFEQILSEEGGSYFKINLIRGQSLGSAPQVMEQHQAGSVDIMYSRPTWFANNIQDFNVLNWGFTFRDREHLNKFLKSSIFEGMNKQVIKKMGVRLLAVGVDQPRILYTRKPVRSVEDIQGMKMRVPGIESYVKLWKTVGTVPTSVPWAEAFIALRSGNVDGAEADASGAYSQKFHVAAPNITMTRHVMSSAHISVNESTWQNLSSGQQQILRDAAKQAVAWMSEMAKGDSQKVLKTMISEGASVTELNTNPFADKARSGVNEQEDAGLWSRGLWQKIRNL